MGQIVSRASVLARLQPVDTAEVRLALPLEQFRFLEMTDAFRGGKNSPGGPAVRLLPSHQGAMKWTGRVVRSVGDQPSIGPSAVPDQSKARNNVPASPPPTGQTAPTALRECNVLMTGV